MNIFSKLKEKSQLRGKLEYWQYTFRTIDGKEHIGAPLAFISPDALTVSTESFLSDCLVQKLYFTNSAGTKFITSNVLSFNLKKIETIDNCILQEYRVWYDRIDK